MPRFFTRAEADALIPRLDPVLVALRDLRAELTIEEEALGKLRQRMLGNGHGLQDDLTRHRARAAEIVAAINERVRQINGWGVLVKDLAMGLVDFPTERDGEEVYLCWRLGEPRVAWWHTIEGGFAAREPLDD